MTSSRILGAMVVHAESTSWLVGSAWRHVVRFGAARLLQPFAGGDAGASSLSDVGFGGPALDARLPFSGTGFALHVGPDGSVFLGMGAIVMVVDPAGVLHHVAGSGVDVPSGDGGAATAATLFGVEQLAVDESGDVLLVDNNASTLRRVRRALGTRSFSEFAVPLGAGALGIFDSYGYETRVVDPFTGATLRSFTHGALGMLQSVTDRDVGDLGVTRSPGQVTLTAAGGQVTTLVDEDGDGYADRVEYVNGPDDTGALPAATQWQWTADGLATGMTDASGTPHAYGYGADGRLMSDQLGDEPAQTLTTSQVMTADTRGQAVVRTSPGGHATRLELTRTLDGDLGQRTTRPDGTTQTSARSTAWEVTQSDALGSVTRTLASDPVLGSGAAYPAHTELNVGSHSLTVDRTVTGEVDASSTRLATWQSTTTLAPGTALEATNSRAWDASTRTWTLTSAEGRVLEVALDEAGRAVSVRPAGLAETTYEYDASGRVTRARRAEGGATRELSLGYDHANRWATSVTDGAMATGEIARDALGRPTTLTEPSRHDATLGYEDATRQLSVTGFGSAGAHQQTYDAHGRLASYTPPAVTGASAGTTSYAYDADGVLSGLTLPDGRSVSLTTDAAGRPETLALSAGTLRIGYDGSTGQLDTTTMPNTAGEQRVELSYDGPLLTRQHFAGAASADVDYAYDDILRVSSVSVAGEVTDYTYDRDGLVTSAGIETLTRDADSGVVVATRSGSVRQSYITTGLLEQVQHSATWPGGRFNETIDARDGAGRILETTETAVQRGYAYDADGHVTEERQNGIRIASYVYDPQGNRTELHRYDATTGAEIESRSATYDARDRLLDDSVASYTYDDAGRRATKTTTDGDVTRYVYDELGHLTRVALPTGVVVEYTYDALGRRTGRTTDGAVDDARDTAWVYGSGPAPIARLNGEGTPQAVYTYGTRSWVPDMVQVYNFGHPTTLFAVISDHRGSVRALANTGLAETLGPVDYDAFGKRSGALPLASLTFVHFGFAGGILDPATGLVHLGARDYDPDTGTWIEPDPIRFAGGDTNLYAYVGVDPINRFDPAGLEWGHTIGFTVGISTINPITSGGGWYYGINLQYVPGVGWRWYKVHADGRDAAGLNVGVSATCNIGRGEVDQPWEGHFDTEQVNALYGTVGHYNSPYYYDDPGPYACPGCWAHHPRGYDGIELGVGAGLPFGVSAMDQEYSPWP